MRKQCLVWIAAVLSAFQAHAQSSVTLYGLVELGLQYANNV